MRILTATFLQSNTDYQKCPKPDRPEYAFIGRSNVGKSSLINRLTGTPGLAKTSQNPGKTQHINHFLINEAWYLVDLPGYGYAKVSQTKRADFGHMIQQYLHQRENLVCTFVLIDCRHAPQKIDIDFINHLGENGIPFYLVFTKADKLSKSQLQQNLDIYINTLKETWEELPSWFVTSSDDGRGRDELLQAIQTMNIQHKERK
jgi:GTP-binding protein